MVNCRSCHDNLRTLHKQRDHASAACITCHTPHRWKVTARETCLTCHEDRKDHYAPDFCGECHPFGMKRALKKEGGKGEIEWVNERTEAFFSGSTTS